MGTEKEMEVYVCSLRPNPTRHCWKLQGNIPAFFSVGSILLIQAGTKVACTLVEVARQLQVPWQCGAIQTFECEVEHRMSTHTRRLAQARNRTNLTSRLRALKLSPASWGDKGGSKGGTKNATFGSGASLSQNGDRERDGSICL